MTIINTNSISGINSITAQGSSGVAFYDSSGSSEQLRIDSGGRLLLGTTSLISSSVASNLQVASDFGPRFNIARSDTTTAVDNLIGAFDFYGNDSNGVYQNCARILAEADLDHGTDDKPTRLAFYTTPDGTATPTEKLRIDSLGSAQFTGSQSPSGRNTRISQYGSLLVATTGELLSNARCSIDAGNGNVISEGNGKFGSTLFAKGGSSGANVFLGLQESPTGGFDPANANVTITAGGSATFSSSVYIGGNADDLVASSKNVSYAGAGPFVSNRSSSSNTAMSIRLNGVDKTLFKSDGKIILATGSPGIQFGSPDNPAASGGIDIASQTLDDYEEGTWTPRLTGSTSGEASAYNHQKCGYVKVGNLVQVYGYLNVANKGNIVGTIKISDFPFAAKGDTAYFHAACFGWYTNLSGITAYGLGIDIAPGSTSHSIVYGNGTGVTGLNVANINTNFACEWTFTYRTA